MKRTAKAHWAGTLKEGKGTLSTQSGTLNNTNYSFKMRFEDEPGTNPEELLGAAHAGCFTMAVGAKLSSMGLNPKSLDTEATVTLEDGSITGVHLVMTGIVDGISASEFETIAIDKGKNCIVSRALSIPITTEAKLIS